jgi:hypothetical protein
MPGIKHSCEKKKDYLGNAGLFLKENRFSRRMFYREGMLWDEGGLNAEKSACKL